MGQHKFLRKKTSNKKFYLRAYLKKIIYISSLTFFLIICTYDLFACNGGNFGDNINVTNNWQTISVQTYTYYTFTATSAGEIFIFSFCQGGGNNLVDTQLEVHYNDGISTGIYNDDACGNGSELTFTAPYSGTYRISVYRYNCQTTVVSAGILAFKRIIPNEQDCVGAITVCQSTYFQSESYFGYGAILDYTSSASCPGLCLETEDKSVWYTFQVQQSGILDFRITPNLPNSDYDWALFNLTNHDCSVLQNISANTNLIVSCNAAYDFGTTGANNLIPNTNSNCQGPSTLGGAPVNNPTIYVNAGEIYYLNIQNWSATQGGYTLDFSNSTASIFDNNSPYIDFIEVPNCGQNFFIVHFNENISCSTISSAFFTLSGPGEPYTITSISGNSCDLGGSMERVFTVNFSPAINTSGNFTINFSGNVTDMCGNTSSHDIWNFTINSGAILNLTSNPSTLNQNICLGNSIANITYNASVGSTCTFNGLPQGVTSSYNPATGQIIISGTPTVTGTFNFTVSVAGSCGNLTSNGVIIVSQNNTPIFNQFGPFCKGETAPVLPNTSLNGINGSWQPAFINTNIVGISTYTFTPLSGQCASQVSIHVEIINTQTPIFSSFGPYCQNSPDIILPSVSNNGISGSWTPYIVNTSVTGTFPFVFTPTTVQCVNNYTVNISITTNPTVSYSIIKPVNCDGNNGIINISATGGTPPFTGIGNFSINSGQHSFIVSDRNSCTGRVDVDIPVPPPLITEIIKLNDVDCFGKDNGKISINITSGNSPYRLDWNNNFEIFATNNFIKEGLKAGSYEFKLTDSNGCSLTKQITINEPAKIEISVNAQGPSCIGNNDGYIELEVKGGTSPYSYSWDFILSNDSILTGLQAGYYNVIIKDANNCTLELNEISLKDFPELCLKIPNALTPNGDGINDIWIIENIELFPEANAWIYNRWGQEIYNDNPLKNPWDGYYKGKILPTGTYLYIIQTNRGLGSVYKGTVTIIY